MKVSTAYWLFSQNDDQRELLDGGEVDDLPGPTGVDAAVAEEADADLVGLAQLRRERRPHRDAQRPRRRSRSTRSSRARSRPGASCRRARPRSRSCGPTAPPSRRAASCPSRARGGAGGAGWRRCRPGASARIVADRDGLLAARLMRRRRGSASRSSSAARATPRTRGSPSSSRATRRGRRAGAPSSWISISFCSTVVAGVSSMSLSFAVRGSCPRRPRRTRRGDGRLRCRRARGGRR